MGKPVSVCVLTWSAPTGPDAEVTCSESKEQLSAFRALIRSLRVQCALGGGGGKGEGVGRKGWGGGEERGGGGGGGGGEERWMCLIRKGRG